MTPQPLTIPPSSVEKPRAANLVFWLALFLIPVCIYFTIQLQFPYRRAAQALQFPYQLDAEEGFLLGQSLRIVSGKGLYLPINQPPYVVDNYPPLYPALWSIAARGAGPSLVPGRWIALGGSLLTALSIAAIILGVGRSWPLAWLCPLLFLTSAANLRWMAYARVDLLAVALSIWGLALMALWGSRKPWARGAAVIMFALAFLTKQTSIIAPAACLLWLFFLDRKTARWFLLELAIAFVFPTVALTLVTKGQYYLHTVTYNENIMHWGELRGWAWQQRALYAPLLLAIALLAAWTLWQIFLKVTRPASSISAADEIQTACAQEFVAPAFLGLSLPALSLPKGSKAVDQLSATTNQSRVSQTTRASAIADRLPPALWLIFLYFLLSALSLISLAKSGAAENYLLEPTAAAAIFLGTALSALFTNFSAYSFSQPSAYRRISAILSAVVVVLLFWHAIRFHVRQIEYVLFRTAPSPNLAALFQGDRVVREIRERPGPVLAEDPIYILKAGEQILFQHFIMTQLAAEGKWDPTPMVNLADHAGISLIAAHQDLFNENQFFNRYPPALRAAIQRNFVLLEKLDREPLQPIFVYVPRKQTAR